jgi:site-specific DNA recombinase
MAIRTRQTLEDCAPLTATYTRLSEANTNGTDPNARQAVDVEGAAERLGGQLVERYSDPEASAYRKGAKRPEFDEMLAAFDEGRINTIVVFRADRLARASREWAKILPRVDDHGLRIIDCAGLDTATTGGRMMLGMLAEAARNEAAVMGARQARAARERAEQGLPARTRYRAFGHTDDQSAVVEHEAALLRDAAQRILDGEASEQEIAAEWTAQGEQRTPLGIRRMLQQPRMIGAREVDGRLIATGAIAPILDRETYERLQLLLARPRKAGRPRTSYLLSDLVRCGRCGEAMSTTSGGGVRRYACHRRPASAERPARGCGRCSVLVENADALIAEAVLSVLDGTVARAEAPDDSPAFDELRRIARKREDLAAAWAAGSLDDDSWRAARAALDVTERHVSASLSRRGPLVSGDVRAEWKRRPLAWRRALVRTVVRAIHIDPAKTPGRFTADRVRIDWVEE